jgi:hypothetical protein
MNKSTCDTRKSEILTFNGGLTARRLDRLIFLPRFDDSFDGFVVVVDFTKV